MLVGSGGLLLFCGNLWSRGNERSMFGSRFERGEMDVYRDISVFHRSEKSPTYVLQTRVICRGVLPGKCPSKMVVSD